MPETNYVVEMKHIEKIYPNGVAANKGVNFNVRKGEIHALMGENGAGKSTLVKMLFGMEQPTSGEIKVNGETVKLSSPDAAISKGIGMVHQHFMLVPSLTVAENMVLGMVPTKKGLFIDYQKAVELTEENAKKYNLHVDPHAKVADIPVGMKQKMEILKALVRGDVERIYKQHAVVGIYLGIRLESLVLVREHLYPAVRQVADRKSVV